MSMLGSPGLLLGLESQATRDIPHPDLLACPQRRLKLRQLPRRIASSSLALPLCAGVISMASSFSRNCASLVMAAVASANVCTMAAGMPGGPKMAYQTLVSMPFSVADSPSVATSGRAGERTTSVTPSAERPPPLMCAMADGTVNTARSTLPATRSVTICGALL